MAASLAKGTGLIGSSITPARLGGIGREYVALAKSADAGHAGTALLERVEAAVLSAKAGAILRAPAAVGAGEIAGQEQSGKCDGSYRDCAHECLLEGL